MRYRTKLSTKVDFPIENLDLSDLSSNPHCKLLFSFSHYNFIYFHNRIFQDLSVAVDYYNDLGDVQPEHIGRILSLRYFSFQDYQV